MPEKETKASKGTIIELLVSSGKEENKTNTENNKNNSNSNENSRSSNNKSQQTTNSNQNEKTPTTQPQPTSQTPSPSQSPSPSPTPKQNPVRSLIILGGKKCVKRYETLNLSVSFYTTNATNIQEYQNATVNWSTNNPNASKITSNGHVTFTGGGTSAVISASVNGLTAKKHFILLKMEK